MFSRKREVNAELESLRESLFARLDELSAQNARLEQALAEARKEASAAEKVSREPTKADGAADPSGINARLDAIEQALREERKVVDLIEVTTEAIANAFSEEIDSVNSAFVRIERRQQEFSEKFEALASTLNLAFDAQVKTLDKLDEIEEKQEQPAS